MKLRHIRIVLGTAAFGAAWYAWLNLGPDLDGVMIVVPYVVVALLGGAFIGSRWAALIVPALGWLPVALQVLTTPEPENVRPSEFPAWFGEFITLVVFIVLALIAWAGAIMERLATAVVRRRRAGEPTGTSTLPAGPTLEEIGHESTLLLGGSAALALAILVFFSVLASIMQACGTGSDEVPTQRVIVPNEFSIEVFDIVDVDFTSGISEARTPDSPIVGRLSFSPRDAMFVTIAAWTEWTTADEVVEGWFGNIDPEFSDIEIDDTRTRGDIEVIAARGPTFGAGGQRAANLAMAVITAEERERAWVIVCSGGDKGSADDVEEACDEVVNSFELEPPAS